MRSRAITRMTAIGSAAAACALLVRRRQLASGATDEESHGQLAGDEMIETSHLTATRAITIRATTDNVWAWLAQLGQGRGGFYSYDSSRTWSAVTSTAQVRSSRSGRTSPSAPKSSFIRTFRSRWRRSSRGGLSFCAAGFRWARRRLPTTSRGPSWCESSWRGRHGCLFASGMGTGAGGRRSWSSPLRRSVS